MWGGVAEGLCKALSGNKAPSEKELSLQVRMHTWTDASKTRDCVWHPFCSEKSVVYGGYKKECCNKYGKNGTHSVEAPSQAALNQGKKNKKAKAARKRRQLQKNK